MQDSDHHATSDVANGDDSPVSSDDSNHNTESDKESSDDDEDDEGQQEESDAQDKRKERQKEEGNEVVHENKAEEEEDDDGEKIGMRDMFDEDHTTEKEEEDENNSTVLHRQTIVQQNIRDQMRLMTMDVMDDSDDQPSLHKQDLSPKGVLLERLIPNLHSDILLMPSSSPSHRYLSQVVTNRQSSSLLGFLFRIVGHKIQIHSLLRSKLNQLWQLLSPFLRSVLPSQHSQQHLDLKMDGGVSSVVADSFLRDYQSIERFRNSLGKFSNVKALGGLDTATGNMIAPSYQATMTMQYSQMCRKHYN